MNLLYNLTAENQIIWEISDLKTLAITIIILLILNIIVTSSIFFKVFSKNKENKQDETKENSNN